MHQLKPKIWRQIVHWNESLVHENCKLKPCWEHVVYKNCSECQKQFLYTICSPQVLSLEFSWIELVIQWTICRHILGLSWCKNKSFWQRFTCTDCDSTGHLNGKLGRHFTAEACPTYHNMDKQKCRNFRGDVTKKEKKRHKASFEMATKSPSGSPTSDQKRHYNHVSSHFITHLM